MPCPCRPRRCPGLPGQKEGQALLSTGRGALLGRGGGAPASGSRGGLGRGQALGVSSQAKRHPLLLREVGGREGNEPAWTEPFLPFRRSSGSPLGPVLMAPGPPPGPAPQALQSCDCS